MNLIPFTIGLTLIVALVAFHIWRRKPHPEMEEYFTLGPVSKQYEWLIERIQNASTRNELAFLEVLTYGFEEDNRGHAWVNDMFSDLMLEIQMRHNQLHLKEISE